MDYKALFSDIDGTLLNSQHRISTRTKSSIARLKQRQVPVILVSARMPRAIVPLQRELGIHDPVVCYGGALVLGPEKVDGTRETILDMVIESNYIAGIIDIIQQEFQDVSLSFYRKDEWLAADAGDEWVAQESAITECVPIPCHLSGGSGVPEGINKILCMGRPERIEGFHHALKERLGGLTVYKSKPTYLEIMPPQVSKSNAIRLLENVLSVDRQAIMAVGDNFNDIDMLHYAGLGVAMGNAPEEVKAASNEVTGTHDDDGLAQLIEKYWI